MTAIKNKKEDLYICYKEDGKLAIKKVQGQQLNDYPDVYYAKVDNKNYQLIHKPSGLLIVQESSKKSLLEQWENGTKERYERVDLNTRYFKEHVEEFNKLIQDYKE